MSKEDGFREATQEQRELYGEDNYASNTSLFRNTTQGSLRTTLEHMGELRDSIDEIEQRFTRLSRKSNITGMPPDESEQSKLRKTVRNTIRTISEVARSKSLSIHTDTIFRKELNRATTTMVGYLKNEQNEDMVLSGLDNLREVIDDSFQDKSKFLHFLALLKNLIRCTENYQTQLTPVPACDHEPSSPIKNEPSNNDATVNGKGGKSRQPPDAGLRQS